MIKLVLLGLNLLLTIGALAGGTLALSATGQAAAGIDKSMLVNSPFTSFLIPGLFLLIVIGFGNLLTAWSHLKKQANAPYYQCLMGIIQCFWIITQCLMLWTINPLHVIFFSIGLVQLIGGSLLVKREKLRFPFSAQQN